MSDRPATDVPRFLDPARQHRVDIEHQGYAPCSATLTAVEGTR